MITHTSIPDFMNMEIKTFYRTYSSIATVLEKMKDR
uniref:Uncharacterized protein n=1 Tax=Caudovirales sp. ctqPn17 TaxID=2825772 RepID=A0A8S5QFE4_9CAUD|nr:MAG TPA: hypothetical protein [Caudovirales sp. ctqPn17]